MAETGKPLNQPFGYKWVGYYTPEDIVKIQSGAKDAPAVPYTDIPVQAGDLKYADLNNDGTIDDFDKGAIGKPNLPSTTLGWSFGGYWKGFSYFKDHLIIALLSMVQVSNHLKVNSNQYIRNVGRRRNMKRARVLNSHV